MNSLKLCILLVVLGLVVGCSSRPQSYESNQDPQSALKQGDAIAKIAESMVGIKYLYGGSDPNQGFDCSGLVFYSHKKLGLNVDRTAYAQYRSAKNVAKSDLSLGDLLFYNINGKPSHVAIYIGNDQFVHAPSSGKKVSITSMNNPYFKHKLVKIGRLYYH